jgi:hypothetical protein
MGGTHQLLMAKGDEVAGKSELARDTNELART